MLARTTAVALVAMMAGATLAAEAASRSWNFDDDAAGQIAKGFTAAEGIWVVTALKQGKTLAQTAKNSNPTFNVALVDDTNVADVDISVEIVSVSGKLDQGGGVVWRAKDAKNYYIARYNPLEDNYRVYTIVDGKRTQLQNADIKRSDGPHTLRVTMQGDHIECYYDGEKALDVKDATFAGPGKIGLWTKADAETYFDNLKLEGK